jgi:hypothetical protein
LPKKCDILAGSPTLGVKSLSYTVHLLLLPQTDTSDHLLIVVFCYLLKEKREDYYVREHFYSKGDSKVKPEINQNAKENQSNQSKSKSEIY